jgi:lipopolysaccharide/colanic/teichoic acid biosynthesis glycosyltransferase
MIRLFRVFIPARTFALLITEILLVTASFLGAYYLVDELDPTGYLLYENGWASILLTTLSVLLAIHFLDLYTDVRVKSRLQLLQQLCMVIGIAFLLQAPISYFAPERRIPILCMVVGGLFSIASIFATRILFSTMVLPLSGSESLLLIGFNPMLAEIGRYIGDHPDSGLRVGGYVFDGATAESLPGKLVARMDELQEMIQEAHPNRLVVGMSGQTNSALAQQLLDLRFAGLTVEEASETYERLFSRVSALGLRPGQLLHSAEFDPRPRDLFWQLLWNWVAAAIAFLVVSPLLLLAALAVRLFSGGPVLDRHPRVGLYGAIFPLYEFRTTRPDGSSTSVGRLLRRLHLNGLPRLLNLLKGQMAIVGPRAERPVFVEWLSQEIPFYRHRFHVRPGVTGWAKINWGREGEVIPDTLTELGYDLYYVKNMSLTLDSLIVLHAFKRMFSALVR